MMRSQQQPKDSKSSGSWDLNLPRTQFCRCLGTEEGGAAGEKGGGNRERATSQQRALTTAGDFFLQRAHSQHLFLITPHPLQKRVGPPLCSRDGGGSGCSITRGIETAEAAGLSALSGLEVTAA